MPETSVAGPLGESEVGDEARLRPMRGGLPDPISERRIGPFDRREIPGQVRERLVREAGSHLARVAQAAVVEVADEQGTEMRTAASRLGPPTDHQLLRGRA